MEQSEIHAIRFVIAAIILGLLPGCGTVPRPHFPLRECWTDPEQITERFRTFPGITEAQAIEAAERLLKLTWGDDAKIVRSAQQLSADIRRERRFYLFLVAYRGSIDEAWTVATRPEAGGTSVCVQVHGQYIADTFVLGAEPVTHLTYPATATETSRGRFLPPAQPHAVDFDTFWARLDYLTGLTNAWATCPSGTPRKNTARGRMEFNPLCHALTNDPAPPSPDLPR